MTGSVEVEEAVPNASSGTPQAPVVVDEGVESSQAEPSPASQASPADEERAPLGRLALIAALPVLATATIVGSIFTGAAPRVVAGVAGLIGIATAGVPLRVRNAFLANALVAVCALGAGLLLVLPTGMANITDLTTRVSEAVASGDVLRPPAPFSPGWRAILAWLMAGVGFASGWAALGLRRPMLSLLLTVPVIGFAAISVPDAQQVATGAIVFALFVASLGMVSGLKVGSEGTRSLRFELRRAARATVLISAVTGGLVLLSTSNLLFPEPLINPTLEPQKPRAVPISEVEDRVLFRAESSISGPWRMGLLDVYDGKDWRLPPFAESALVEIPRSGVIDNDLQPGVKATFTVADLGGAVLPGLPNMVGVLARGDLAYDARTGNIRTTQGIVEPGTTYTAVAARLPNVDELRRPAGDVPADVLRFLEIPPPPPAVKDLLQRAPAEPSWDRFDFLRQKLLDTVVAAGAGTPVGITPERVDDMLAGSREGTPFEIAAAQAMLARWAGVPSRMAYGFDSGERVGKDIYEVRPRHGATFIEVYFPGYKWLPVLSTPKQAKATTTEGEQQFNPNVIPSEDIAIVIYLPTATAPESVLATNVRRIVGATAAALAVIALIYFLLPIPRKGLRRARLRSWAVDAGPLARIAVAYAEWRDVAIDYGYRHDSETPLMFMLRFGQDREHELLAWLVTRTMWGDLSDDVRPSDAVNAEELSRSLRRRLSQAHPWTLRVVAALSRVSLRHPHFMPSSLAGTEPTPEEVQTRAPQEEPAA